MSMGSATGKTVIFSVILILVLTSGIGIVLSHKWKKAEAVQAPEEPVRPVKVINLKGSSFNETRSFPGVVEATREKKDGRLRGFSDNYIPVRFDGPDDWYNSFQMVEIQEISADVVPEGKASNTNVGSEDSRGQVKCFDSIRI